MTDPTTPTRICRDTVRAAVGHGALAAGVVVLEIGVDGAIDGAASPWELRLMMVAIVAAPALLTFGTLSPRSPARPTAAVVSLFALVALGRLIGHVDRLTAHVRLQRDEPLTTISLTLQTTVAAAAFASIATFAVWLWRSSPSG